ncbi:MAG: flagellar protein FlgN [Agarilytica sp.]
MMNQPITADTIQTQISGDIHACNTLLELLDKEQDALQSRDAESLAEIIDQKLQPLTHLEESAKQRASWANISEPEKFSEKWNAMLSKLATGTIKDDWETLKKLTKECQYKNEVNGKILGRQQQVYGRLLELMRGQTKAPTLYTASGTATSNQSSFKVDEA